MRKKPLPGMVTESITSYSVSSGKSQGNYTLSDYYALPRDRRYELIDGTLIEMSSPSTGHQFISMEISWQLNSFVHKKKGPCKVLAAPTDVQLDEDDLTMVQPDILVVCDSEKLKKAVSLARRISLRKSSRLRPAASIPGSKPINTETPASGSTGSFIPGKRRSWYTTSGTTPSPLCMGKKTCPSGSSAATAASIFLTFSGKPRIYSPMILINRRLSRMPSNS